MNENSNPKPNNLLLSAILISIAIIAHAYILKGNFSLPSLNSGTKTQAQTQGTPTTATAQAPAAGGKVVVDVGHLPIKGDQNAKVTVIEFADFRCPFCESYFKSSESQLLKDYVDTGKVKYAFRHYAFLGQQSVWASEAAECANEQGKFWAYHDWLYNNQVDESNLDYYSKDNLIKYSANVGADTNQFASCLNSDKYAKQVQDDLSLGQQAGVTGTPAMFVLHSSDTQIDSNYLQQQIKNGSSDILLPNGNRLIFGAQPTSTFQQDIDEALANAK